MDIIAHDNTAYVIDKIQKVMREEASFIRMAALEDTFSDFMGDLNNHLDDTVQWDAPYQERG